jgi:hypothetical protein
MEQPECQPTWLEEIGGWRVLKREAEALATFLWLLLTLITGSEAPILIRACAHEKTGDGNGNRIADSLHVTVNAAGIGYHVYFQRLGEGYLRIDRISYLVLRCAKLCSVVVVEELPLPGASVPWVREYFELVIGPMGLAVEKSTPGVRTTIAMKKSLVGEIVCRLHEVFECVVCWPGDGVGKVLGEIGEGVEEEECDEVEGLAGTLDCPP